MKLASSFAFMSLCALSLPASGFYEYGAQQLLALTGGVHAKMVWVRSTACQDEDYMANAVLIALDTREGGARVLDSQVGVKIRPRITRDGGHVIWVSGPGGEWMPSNTTEIIDWDGLNKKVLIDGNVSGNPGHFLCVNLDRAAGRQYVYAARPKATYGDWGCCDEVYRIPLSGTTVDLSQKEAVYTQSGITPFFSVSSNGQWAAVACPWPAVGRYDMRSGEIQASWGNMDNWACMPNISPDSSGWLLHVEGTHRKIELIPLVGSSKWIEIYNDMPGNRGNYDIQDPFWSNHPRFVSGHYPLLECSSNMRGEVCAGKFNADYSAIDWVAITDTNETNAYREGFADLWLENGETPQSGTGSGSADVQFFPSAFNSLSIERISGDYRISIAAHGPFSLSIASVSGRKILAVKTSGPARYTIHSHALAPGLFMAVLRTESGTITRHFFAGK